jgi:hypothetical protein
VGSTGAVLFPVHLDIALETIKTRTPSFRLPAKEEQPDDDRTKRPLNDRMTNS